MLLINNNMMALMKIDYQYFMFLYDRITKIIKNMKWSNSDSVQIEEQNYSDDWQQYRNYHHLK